MGFLSKQCFSPIIVFLVGILIGMGVMDLITRTSISKFEAIKADTSYNKVKLDSLKLVINNHDTTIYKLNIKLKDDVEKVFHLNDSASIELFKRLSSSASQQE